MRIQFGTATSQGKVRTSNEDSFVADSAGRLFLVADGMGGHAAGEVASSTAAATVKDVMGSSRREGGKIEDLLLLAVREANGRIYEAQRNRADLSGMGSTLTLVSFAGSSYYIAHVGDSRAYLLRDGTLEQLTRDHSLVWHLFESGVLRKDELSSHPQKNLITRSIGPHPQVEIDLECGQAREGDTYLLCSDGLTDVLSDEVICQMLSRPDKSPQQLGDALVSAANTMGGPDNITVIVVRLVPGE